MSGMFCHAILGATTSDGWLNSLFSHDAGVPIVAIAGGCAVGIVAVIGHVWQQVNQTNTDADLKRDMLDRGMSVDDIERVLKARSTTDGPGAKK